METKKGCLANKTQRQKIKFFKSLYGFKTSDPVFYKEQYEDLLPHERTEFIRWKDMHRRYKPNPAYWLFTLYWWNPFCLLALIIHPFASFFIEGAKGFWKILLEIGYALKRYDWT